MLAPAQQYKWWLLDADLDIVSGGSIVGVTLMQALADLSREIDRQGARARRRPSQPCSLIVYRGESVVAVRPSTLGIC